MNRVQLEERLRVLVEEAVWDFERQAAGHNDRGNHWSEAALKQLENLSPKRLALM